ncbi:MAG TPA: ABC transporter substrate-binding protein [Mesorhizobium sp.]|jgi:polar amino acid transport system substrate-binding protein|uniref:ABC transporter substrate-binding protein n=1 Tax=Mesorhizobium sp. TaxID=1871066 RepID=UPI002DDCA738|nr:ABC transporter substrate-binding protein [Mesorhizobium sp.]HEV2507290.1 ABC transporter substrate-binding protein [Mesorhizobium sp.]
MLLNRRNLIGAFAALTMGLGAASLAHAETLLVGAYPANPPWENKLETGQFEGFEVDLVKEIGKRIGSEVEIQDLGFQALFSATVSGRIDLAISSITINNDRLQNQAFTQGYYDSDIALVAKKDTPLKTLEDMKGKTVGAISASVGEAWIKANTEKYGIKEYRGYDTQQNLILDVQSGRLDGAIGDIAGFQFAFTKMPDMAVVTAIPTGDKFGIMMKKGSPLLEKVNGAIDAIKKDGTMAALHKKWLGADAAADSSTNKILPIPQAQ